MRTIAVINQKGGVGKTTSTANLGHALALQGHRVLVVDLDPQGHLAACLGLFKTPHQGMDAVLIEGNLLKDNIIATRELLDLVPAGEHLAQFEQVRGGTERGKVLKNCLQQVEGDVDYVLIDCPPSAGLLVVNAVLAADDILVPVAGDYLSLTGLAKLMLTIKRIESLCETPPNKWIFLSRFVSRRRLSQEVLEKIIEHFPQSLLHTTVREAAVLAECAGAGKSIFEYKGSSTSADEFTALANDLLQGKVMNNE